MTDSSPVQGLPRSEREAQQRARLVAGDVAAFKVSLLESVQVYADTEAGRIGMGSPVMARMVLWGIERDVDMLIARRAQEEPGSAPPPEPEFCDKCGKPCFASWELFDRARLARAVPRGEPSPNATALAERFLADKTVWPLGCNLVAQRVTRGFAVWLDAQAVDRGETEGTDQ